MSWQAIVLIVVGVWLALGLLALFILWRVVGGIVTAPEDMLDTFAEGNRRVRRGARMVRDRRFPFRRRLPF